MNNVKEILKDLKNITMLTGELSTVHEESLQKWPYIAYEGVGDVEIKYDLSKDYINEVGEGYVDFYLHIVDSELEQDKMKQRGDAITGWVRDSLWNEIKVRVFFNNTVKYENSTVAKKEEKKNGLK